MNKSFNIIDQKHFWVPKSESLRQLFNTEVYKEIYYGWDCDPCD
jgi:hypothetical protein